jgi:peptidyl-prolyl cis-trans isomerase D
LPFASRWLLERDFDIRAGLLGGKARTRRDNGGEASMLDNMRTASNTFAGRVVMALLFGLLALAFFISFGPSGRTFDAVRGSGVSVVAKVNGEPITRTEFERYYYNQVRQFGQIDQATLDRVFPRSRVLDELIKDRLLAEAALQQGIGVGDDELLDTIRRNPSFEEDGKFSEDRYKLVVQRSLGLTVDVFEDNLRRDLRASKIITMLRETAKVTDAQLKQAFRDENEKVDLTFVRFSPAFYAAQANVSDAEVASALKDKQAAVDEAYRKQSARFHAPKRVQARHILVKVDPSAAPADKDRTRQKLIEIRKRIEGGADFGAEAKISSQAGDAAAGGELGIMRQDDHVFDPALQQAAFALEAGKVSDVIETKQGFELVQAEKIFPPDDKSLEEVRVQLTKELLVREKEIALAQKDAAAAQQALKEGKALSELYPAAKAAGDPGKAAPPSDRPEVATTGSFARSASGFIPKLGSAAELQGLIFGSPKVGAALPGPIQVGDGFVVAVVTEYQPPDWGEFQKKKEDLRENALRQEEGQLMQSLRTKLRSQAVVEINTAALGPQG